LLGAVLAGKLPKPCFTPITCEKYWSSNDREALWAVEKAFGKVRMERNPEREESCGGRWRHTFAPTPGIFPIAGRSFFVNVMRAIAIPSTAKAGRWVRTSPANGRASFEQLLSNVLDPSLVIGPPIKLPRVVDQDGRNLTGLIAEDNEQGW
jgi:hypothetical protein